MASPPCVSDSAFADIVRVYKFYLLTYLQIFFRNCKFVQVFAWMPANNIVRSLAVLSRKQNVAFWVDLLGIGLQCISVKSSLKTTIVGDVVGHQEQENYLFVKFVMYRFVTIVSTGFYWSVVIKQHIRNHQRLSKLIYPRRGFDGANWPRRREYAILTSNRHKPSKIHVFSSGDASHGLKDV